MLRTRDIIDDSADDFALTWNSPKNLYELDCHVILVMDFIIHGGLHANEVG